MGNNLNKGILFLDRDGIINQELGDYVIQANDLQILPHALEGIKLANEKGLKVVVITNQGGIAKGKYTKEGLIKIHAKMLKEVNDFGAKIDHIYFCPHHSNIEKCLCRKPNSLMLERGLHMFNCSPQNAIFLGDSVTDIQAGEKIGVESILIKANTNWVGELTKRVDSAY